ncbi:unnamed protein product [Dibothriocephalus latus]|uniref:Uncharacterized protein n=1 Tax=Dibothriocephalus latus TaxID=60516 RepID=A0A3P7NQ11_DIBLA|nr:unnamed protein product [Dibothriocephalus latus]
MVRRTQPLNYLEVFTVAFSTFQSILGEWKLACKGRLRFFDYAQGTELDGPDSVTDEPEPVDIKPSSSSSRNSRKLPQSVREKLQVPADLNQNEVLQHLVDRIFQLAQPPKASTCLYSRRT